MLVDTHCHLDLEQYDQDRDKVIQRAIQNKIKKIVTIGTDIMSSEKAVSLAEKYAIIYAAAGIHPNDCAMTKEDDILRIKQLTDNKKVIAIGEIGLDYYHMKASKEQQMDIFERQLHLAQSLNLPVIIHNRDAHADIYAVLKQREYASVNGVLHSFSGDEAFLEAILDLHFMVSYTGVVTFKKNTCESLVKNTPFESLLLETDSPFLTPVPFRGKRNEPAYLIYTAQKIAQIKNIDIEELADTTGKNALNLFKFNE
jgi:TatD DNase family protein